MKNHVRNILEKLQLHSRMEAVMIRVREKLIEIRLTRVAAAAGGRLRMQPDRGPGRAEALQLRRGV